MTLKLRDGVAVAEMDHGWALLDQDSGEYWTLNPTGALVLRSLLGGETSEQAAQRVTEQYAIDIDNASQDIADLVRHLCSAGLVEQ
jgi:hypothetical protein